MLDPEFRLIQELDPIETLSPEQQVPIGHGADGLGSATLEQLADFVLEQLPVLRDGVDGRTVLHGDGPPVPELGVDGDFYLSSDLTLYGPKLEGAWGAGSALRGLSAYESAVAHGFVGTEAEWIDLISGGSAGYADEAAAARDDAIAARDASIAARDLSIGAKNTALAARDDAIAAAEAAAAPHTHAIADVDGLQEALDEKAPLEHSHAIADVAGLQGALDDKLQLEPDALWATPDYMRAVGVAALTLGDDTAEGTVTIGHGLAGGVGWLEFDLANFAGGGWLGSLTPNGRIGFYRYGTVDGWEFDVTPYVGNVKVALEGHAHAIADVAGLQAALDDKADVAGLDAVLDSKLDDSQRGAANGVASLDAGGKVPAAQLPEPAAVTIADVDGLQDALDGKSDEGHNHGIADVVGLTAALADKLDDSQLGAANGVASLDATGKVPAAQLPASSGGSGPTTIADVDGLQDALDAKATVVAYPDWSADAFRFDHEALTLGGGVTIEGALTIFKGDATGTGGFNFDLKNWTGGGWMGGALTAAGRIPIARYGSVGGYEFDVAPYVGANVIWHAGNFDPASKAAAVHAHALADVTGLNAALAGKVDTSSRGAANGVATLDASGLIPAGQLAGLNGAFAAKVDTSSVGAANGVASLDGAGKVPAAQLPAYVDDVLEYANLAAFPAVGETGKIYLAVNSATAADPTKEYRWSGSVYTEIRPAPGSTDAVAEGAANLYFTAARVLATAIAGLVGVAGTPAAGDSLLTVLGKILKGFFTDHSGQGGAVHANAVAGGAAGFMTGADKTKLDAISGSNTGDQNAAGVAFTPAGNVAATNVQAAIAELDSEKRSLATDYATLVFIIDGGGAAITTGQKGHVTLEFAGVIEGWTLVADQAGSIVVDVWKDTYANFPPTVGDTIAGTEKPTLTAAQKAQDTNLTTWGTTVAAGDVFAFNVDSVATVQRVTLTLKIRKT